MQLSEQLAFWKQEALCYKQLANYSQMDERTRWQHDYAVAMKRVAICEELLARQASLPETGFMKETV